MCVLFIKLSAIYMYTYNVYLDVYVLQYIYTYTHTLTHTHTHTLIYCRIVRLTFYLMNSLSDVL